MPFIPQPNPNDDAGFTLVEVLVGLLVITGFISTAMQALVTATVFKVKGEELSEATTWIQEDLERVKFLANRLHYTVDADDPTQSKYTPVDAACEGTETTGYAAVLSRNLDAVDASKTSTIGDRPYTLTRDIVLPDKAPYNMLALKYKVAATGEVPIAITHAKVIPDASLACP